MYFARQRRPLLPAGGFGSSLRGIGRALAQTPQPWAAQPWPRAAQPWPMVFVKLHRTCLVLHLALMARRNAEAVVCHSFRHALGLFVTGEAAPGKEQEQMVLWLLNHVV